MSEMQRVTRRESLLGLGGLAAASLAAGVGGPQAALAREDAGAGRDGFQTILAAVQKTPLVDTHEHLIEETTRLEGKHPRVVCDDWTLLLTHYFNSDLHTAGMPEETYQRLVSRGVAPRAKWDLLAPYWDAVKNTGYGQALRLTIRDLYGVEELSAATVAQVQQGYQRTRRPGFYEEILRRRANLDSCQVCSFEGPFKESAQPTLLMQDLNPTGFLTNPLDKTFVEPTGIRIATLADCRRVIDWWFNRYGRYAVAVKVAAAYHRDIDFQQAPSAQAEAALRKRLARQPVSPEEAQALEDHLFWHVVARATEHRLPVKLHTGYYAGYNRMPLERLARNAASACGLCQAARATPARFVFMHICYPYYEELIAVAKQFSNAYVDMCWAWIINPIAAKDFLKKYLVTAPANKILTFGGDYGVVELVDGHAQVTRRGIALALWELVAEGWLSLADALALVEPIMNGNARRIFDLDEKKKTLAGVRWR